MHRSSKTVGLLAPAMKSLFPTHLRSSCRYRPPFYC